MLKYVSAMFQPFAYRFITEFARARGWAGALERSYVPPKELRALRGLTRYRVKLVEHQSAVACRIQKLLERCNIKLASVASNVLGVSGTGDAAWPVQTDSVQKAERRLPADVGGSTFRMCDMHCLLPSKRSDLLIFPSFTP